MIVHHFTNLDFPEGDFPSLVAFWGPKSCEVAIIWPDLIPTATTIIQENRFRGGEKFKKNTKQNTSEPFTQMSTPIKLVLFDATPRSASNAELQMPKSQHGLKCLGFGKIEKCSITHRIHIWYIYLHLLDLYGKSR